MLYRMLLAYRTVGRTFGAWGSTLVTGFLLGGLRVTVSVAMVLDYLFFPKLHRTRVERPVVIVGNPRTGTTFLQRFMVDNGLGTGSQVWQLLYPSLLLRTLLRPLLPLLEKVSPARHHSTAAHKTGLTSVETDDPALLFHFFDGFFLYGFILAWAEDEYLQMFDPRERDTSRRDFAWLDKVWRRNLVSERADRVVAKVFSLGPRLPQFLDYHPDARVLYMLRDPLSVVPSGMSLVTGVLDRRFGFWKLPETQRQRYLERLYQAFLTLIRRFHEDWVEGRIPSDRVMLVPFHRLMKDFDTLMNEILTFIDVEPDEELSAEIERVAEKQRAYKSKHKYDLARFGLTEERIREDYAFLYDTFDLPRVEIVRED